MLQVIAEGGGSRWKQYSHEKAATRLYSVVFQVNSFQLFFISEEQRTHYNKEISRQA